MDRRNHHRSELTGTSDIYPSIELFVSTRNDPLNPVTHVDKAGARQRDDHQSAKLACESTDFNPVRPANRQFLGAVGFFSLSFWAFREDTPKSIPTQRTHNTGTESRVTLLMSAVFANLMYILFLIVSELFGRDRCAIEM